MWILRTSLDRFVVLSYYLDSTNKVITFKWMIKIWHKKCKNAILYIFDYLFNYYLCFLDSQMGKVFVGYLGLN